MVCSPDMPCLTDTAYVMLHQDEDVIAHFNSATHVPELIGAVEAVRLVRDRATNIGKGFGFVLFRTKVCEFYNFMAGWKGGAKCSWDFWCAEIP